MSWTYSQGTGRLFRPDGSLAAFGYAGHGAGVNNPLMQNMVGIGPLPRGTYTMGAPLDKVNTGPFSIPLTPDPANEMFGRSAFYCHGDNGLGNQSASEGCIIMPRAIREAMWASGDATLIVIA